MQITDAGEAIVKEIEASGPITFARFMERALYDPVVGYYARSPSGIGPAGDYVTSPEVHQTFGEMLGVQVEEMWRRLGSPSPFWLVEAGPGRGTLARDLLDTIRKKWPSLALALRLVLIERSPALRQAQRHALGDAIVTWLDADAERWPQLGTGLVLANELFDAMPVHRVVMTTGDLREDYVGLQGGELAFETRAMSTPSLDRQIADGGGSLAVGQRGEVNLKGPAWVVQAGGLLDRGYWLFIDYGAPANVLYGSQHPRGTLRCYFRHTVNEDVLRRVGRQDLTAHVDFSAITRAARGAGLGLVGATNQEQFLTRLGLSRSTVDRRGARSREAEWNQARAARRLTSPSGLGALLVVAYARGVEAPLTGFESG